MFYFLQESTNLINVAKCNLDFLWLLQNCVLQFSSILKEILSDFLKLLCDISNNEHRTLIVPWNHFQSSRLEFLPLIKSCLPVKPACPSEINLNHLFRKIKEFDAIALPQRLSMSTNDFFCAKQLTDELMLQLILCSFIMKLLTSRSNM